MSFSLLQATSGQGSGAVASFQLAFPSDVTAGSLILVEIGSFRAPASGGVTDSQGNAYTKDASLIASQVHASVWRAIAGSSGPLTVTVAAATTLYPSVSLEEYSFSGALSVAAQSTASGSAATSQQAPAMAVGGGGLAVAAMAIDGAPGAVSAASPWTLGQTQPYIQGSTEGMAAARIVGTAGGSLTPGFTTTGAVTYAIAAVAYRAGVAPGVLSYLTRSRRAS